MPRLLYVVDHAAAPVDLAAQVIAVLRLQEFAGRTGLRVEESCRPGCLEFALLIPPDRMNHVLWDLDSAGLLTPTQEITGAPDLHVRLEERFATLTWVDDRLLFGVSRRFRLPFLSGSGPPGEGVPQRLLFERKVGVPTTWPRARPSATGFMSAKPATVPLWLIQSDHEPLRRDSHPIFVHGHETARHLFE